MAEVESVIEPDGVGDDIGWESVTLVCVHPAILPIHGSSLVGTGKSIVAVCFTFL